MYSQEQIKKIALISNDSLKIELYLRLYHIENMLA